MITIKIRATLPPSSSVNVHDDSAARCGRKYDGTNIRNYRNRLAFPANVHSSFLQLRCKGISFKRAATRALI